MTIEANEQDFLIDENKLRPLLVGDGPIVVVDDDEDQHFLVKKCFAKSNCNHELLLFFDGAELVDYLERINAAEEPFPSLVLLDINMPGTNGFQALHNIREHEELKKLPIIIMFTSSASPDDIQRAVQEGANGYWIKPMSISGYKNFFNGIG